MNKPNYQIRVCISHNTNKIITREKKNFFSANFFPSLSQHVPLYSYNMAQHTFKTFRFKPYSTTTQLKHSNVNSKHIIECNRRLR